MEAVRWIPTIRDGRCFWDAVAKVLGADGPDRVKARALRVDDRQLQGLIAQHGGSASDWRNHIQRHIAGWREYADHFAIAPAAANLCLLIVIWDAKDGRLWTYRPAKYDTAVLLKLEHEHFEVADAQTYTQLAFEKLVAGCSESWEKHSPLLRGGGPKPKPKAKKADVALEIPATVQQWDAQPVVIKDTWTLTGLNVTSLRLHIEQVLAMSSCVKVLVETKVHGQQCESLCSKCQKAGYEVLALPSNAYSSPIVILPNEHIGQLERWRQVSRVQAATLVLPSGCHVGLLAVYCYADDPVKRSEMHHDIIEYIAADKNKKHLVVGDFNQDAGTMWPVE
eukprot:2629952-Amphidinium_carterae.2